MNEIEAISVLETRIKYPNSDTYGGMCEAEYQQEAVVLAIEALRERAERSKGCGYCIGENPPPIVENSETCIFYNRRANEFYDGAYPLDWTACPVYGRKLDGGGQDESKIN